MIILPAGLLSSPVSAHLAHYLPSSAGVALRDGATGVANPLSSFDRVRGPVRVRRGSDRPSGCAAPAAEPARGEEENAMAVPLGPPGRWR